MLVLRFLVLALAGAVAEDDDGATATANLRALSREALESILLESAAEHPGVAALLLRATTAAAPPFTVTAMSHSRVALDGDATPSAVGRLVTVHGTGFVVGAAALCNVTSTDSFEGFERGFAYDPEHVLQVAAKVVSPTSLTCLLPQVPTGGPARVMVSMDGGATFPLGRSANFTYFALLSFAVGRRPYTIEQTGKLIVGVAPELLQAAAATQSAPVPLVNLQAAATVEGAKPLQLALATTALSAPDSVLSFPLAALPAQLDAVVALTVSVKGGVTVTKRRRLVRVPLEPDQEAVIVDHHTRGLSIVKPNYHHNQQHRRELKPWLGTGWYMYGGFECQGQSHAPAIDWGNAPGPGNFSGHVDLLARRGFNQLMIYDLETLWCGGNPIGIRKPIEETLLPLMNRMADVGVRVMVSVKQWMQQSTEATTGAPGSINYESLKNVTSLLKNHRALLGWYVCDDCCPGGGQQPDDFMRNYSLDYALLKTFDPYHPAFGAIQCPRSWEFLDGPGGRGGGSPGPLAGGAPLIFDVAMHENYDDNFAGHAGEGPRAPIEQAMGDMPLRNYPLEYEPLVNCGWGEGLQYFLYAPAVENGVGPMGGVPIPPMSPDGLRGIAWLGTKYDMNDNLWYTYNKLGSASPSARERLGIAASQLAFEKAELYPSLTAVKDGSIPRAVVSTVTSDSSLQGWVKSKAWVEPPAPGTTGGVSTGDWNPITGIDPGKCKPLGQTQTIPSLCATSAVCVHVLIANTAPQPATVAGHVKIVDNFGRDTSGELSHGSFRATLPFGGFESGQIVPILNGMFSMVAPAFSVSVLRIGCAAPPVEIGNLVPNPSYEDVTITGAVASWALFTQHEQRDQRCMLSSDTMYAHTGRHSAKLVLPSPTPGAVISYKGGLAIPFSLGSGVGNCGSGYQGFLLKPNHTYNISIWARSDQPGMNLSIASGRWAGSSIARIWEYIGSYPPSPGNSN